jgi:hypothetical protein
LDGTAYGVSFSRSKARMLVFFGGPSLTNSILFLGVAYGTPLSSTYPIDCFEDPNVLTNCSAAKRLSQLRFSKT